MRITRQKIDKLLSEKSNIKLLCVAEASILSIDGHLCQSRRSEYYRVYSKFLQVGTWTGKCLPILDKTIKFWQSSAKNYRIGDFCNTVIRYNPLTIELYVINSASHKITYTQLENNKINLNILYEAINQVI